MEAAGKCTKDLQAASRRVPGPWCFCRRWEAQCIVTASILPTSLQGVLTSSLSLALFPRMSLAPCNTSLVQEQEGPRCESRTSSSEEQGVWEGLEPHGQGGG